MACVLRLSNILSPKPFSVVSAHSAIIPTKCLPSVQQSLSLVYHVGQQSGNTRSSSSNSGGVNCSALGVPSNNVKNTKVTNTSARNLLDITGDVFSSSSTGRLLQTLAIYQVCAFDIIVANSLQLLRLGQRCLGNRLLELLIQPFYRQFVAGSHRHQLASAVTLLRQNNIRLILTSMLEADIDKEAASEQQLTENLVEVIRQIAMVSQVTKQHELPAIQTKITAHMDANILVQASRVFAGSGNNQTKMVEQLASAMMSSHRFAQVAGLTSHQQAAWEAGARRLKTLGDACAAHNVCMYVDGEYSYTNPAIAWITLALMVLFNQQQPLIRSTQQCYLKTIQATLEQEYAICKRLDACFGAKLVRGAYLARERELARHEGRESPVCDSYEATTCNYMRAVEFTLRKAVEDQGKTCCMVATHNHQSVLHALSIAKQLGLLKLTGEGVHNSQTPTKTAMPPATSPAQPATTFPTPVPHNSLPRLRGCNSVAAMSAMPLKESSPTASATAPTSSVSSTDAASGHERLSFGQVYGMADYLTVPLGRSGYVAYKAVPFGEFSTVMPYLSRRAAESQLLQQGVRVERRLILGELKRRMKIW